jgi:elongation factor P--(R)-beta-lysine ligase
MLSLKELHLRAALLRFVRLYFFDLGFLEVDTPVRQPVIIPERHIIPLRSDNWFLQASPELCMKRLLASGCEKIFQICPCFRAQERGRLHLEEFTMLEWYRMGADYRDLMTDCENMLRFLKESFNAEFPELVSDYSKSIFHDEKNVDLTTDGERLTLEEAFARFSPIPLSQAMEEGQFDELLVEYVEPHLGMHSPFFLYDYPVAMASLAKVNETDPKVAERFELYIQGIELANGFSELTDGNEQRKRFDEELRYIQKSGGHPSLMPERFLSALDGLDSCAGIAFGLDRLFMLILGKGAVKDAATFSPSDL